MSSAATVLRRFPVLAELSDGEVEKLAGSIQEVELSRGDYLFREGDPGDAVYFLHEGVVVAERAIDPGAGARKELAILSPLSPVGELALAAPDTPRSASVRVEVRGRALRLERDAFEQLCAEAPTVALKLFRALFAEASRRLRATNEELVAVYEISRLVAAAGELKDIAENVVRTIASRLDAHLSVVALYSQESNALQVVHASGDKSDNALGATIPLEEGLAARAFDEKRALLVEQMIGAMDPWEEPSMIVAPLIVGDAGVGVLLLGRASGSPQFSAAQMSLVAAVANVSARLFHGAFSAV